MVGVRVSVLFGNRYELLPERQTTSDLAFGQEMRAHFTALNPTRGT